MFSLQRDLLNCFRGRKFTNFVVVHITGLNLTQGRNHVFVILNNGDLDLTTGKNFHGFPIVKEFAEDVINK